MKEESIRLEIVNQNEEGFNPNNYFSYFSNTNLDKQQKLTNDIKISTLTSFQNGLTNDNKAYNYYEERKEPLRDVIHNDTGNDNVQSNDKDISIKKNKEDVVNYMDDRSISISKTNIQNDEEQENNHEIYKQLESSYSKTNKHTTPHRIVEEKVKAKAEPINSQIKIPGVIINPILNKNDQINENKNELENKQNMKENKSNLNKDSQTEKVSTKCHCIIS